MSIYKKHIVFIALILIVGGFFFWQKRVNQTQSEQTTPTTEKWSTYHDPKYHFRIDYPADLSIVHEDKFVSFVVAGSDGPGGTGSTIFIEPTSFTTPEEAVVASNKKSRDGILGSVPDNQIPAAIIDGSITIDGNIGIVIHDRVDGFDHPFPKSVLFIKDGYLFTISDNSVDSQRTWNSFHFE